jgi:transmembrane sensor
MEDRLRYLFKKFMDNTCSYKELEEFFSYIHKADRDELLRHLIKKVYNELGEIASNTTYVNEKGHLILTSPEWLTSPPSIKPKRSKLISRINIVALIIVIAGITWIIKVSTPDITKTATLSSVTKKTTNRSEFKFLLLGDSTQVWLNAASSLEFPDQFDGTSREVFLSGEAFFDVKHADKIPFIIHTGNIATTVLGTSFNIKAYPGQKTIIISVSRGKVKITRKNNVVAMLTKGQQVKLKEDGDEMMVKNIPSDGIAAWQQGNIVYDDETLGDIIADMQRVYNANIRITNTDLQNLKISTSFKREIGIEQALQVLCKLTDTELKQKDGIYLIQ